MSCLPNNKLSFITNNVKGMQSLKKRLKLIQYFKRRVGPCGLLFYKKLIQTVKWNRNGRKTFMVKFSFLTEKQIFVLFLFVFRITYFRTEKFTVKKQQTDYNGHILILDVSINNSEYILINL